MPPTARRLAAGPCKGATGTPAGRRLQVGQAVVGEVDQVGGDLLLAGGAALQPPLPDQRDHPDQRLAVELGECRVVATGVELLAEDVLDLAGHLADQGRVAVG